MAASVFLSGKVYQGLVEACAGMLLMILAGFVCSMIKIFDKGSIAVLNKVVFFVALPCLMFRTLAVSNFVSLPWRFSLVFLALRAAMIGINALYMLVFERHHPEVFGRYLCLLIGTTWMSPVIYGAPLMAALFKGSPAVAPLPVLASLSSIFFQLPFMLFVYEVQRWLNKRRDRAEKKVAHVALEERAKDDPEAGVANWGKLSAGRKQDAMHPTASLAPPASASSETYSSDSSGSGTTSSASSTSSSTSLSSTLDDGGVAVARPSPAPAPVFAPAPASAPAPATPPKSKGRSFMQLGLFTVVNPVLIGTALGAIWGGAKINHGKLPDFLELLTSNLGNLVTPVAMLEIGVFLYHICLPVFRQALSSSKRRLPGPAAPATAAGGFDDWRVSSVKQITVTTLLVWIVKHLLVPLLTVAFCEAFGIRGYLARCAVILASLPVSVAGFTLAVRYKTQSDVMAAIIAFGNITMVVALIMVLATLDKTGAYALPDAPGVKR